MFPRQQPQVSATQAQAERAIAETLLGGDSLPAWNAVWDLVQSSDSQAKQEVLSELRNYVADSVAGDAPIDQARDFERAIDHSMRAPKRRRRILPSREVREQAKQDQIEAHRKAMREIGVRPGEGIPMWALYMTRRNKRSWG